MSDKASGAHDKYIPLDEAAYLLNVRYERISWFIATGRLASKRNPRDKSSKLVSLQDVSRLRNFSHLLAPWIIYALIAPRNDAVRYVGRAYEPQIRLREHLRSVEGAVGAGYEILKRMGCFLAWRF